MADRYTHGHQEPVLRSHRWRTATNSCAYLLADLRAGQRLLDVGCGPGNLTLELAARVAPAEVIGIDVVDEVLQAAQRDLEASGSGSLAADVEVSFRNADVYELPFEDGSFDVVHAHQVLQHLADPLLALEEMRRVLSTEGILAVRDSDYGAFMWSPADPRLRRWMDLHHDVSATNGVEADAGRHLLGWVRAAGFGDARYSSSTWTFATDEQRQWWGALWAERIEGSSFRMQALQAGLSDPEELAGIAAAFREWAQQPDGVFVCVHGEVLARR